MLSLVTVLHFIISHIYFFLSPHLDRHGHELALATQKCLCPDPKPLVMALDSFSGLLFVPPAPEILAEIKRTILHCLLPPVLRLQLLHNAI